jgi:hypothetical protein
MISWFQTLLFTTNGSTAHYVAIELRKSADAHFVMDQLYRRTKLQVRVSVNLVGLIGREPKVGRCALNSTDPPPPRLIS